MEDIITILLKGFNFYMLQQSEFKIQCTMQQVSRLTEGKVKENEVYIHFIEGNFLIMQLIKGRNFTLRQDYKDNSPGTIYTLEDYYISTRAVSVDIIPSLNSKGFMYQQCTMLQNGYFVLDGTYEETIYPGLLRCKEGNSQRIVHPVHPILNN